MAQGEVPVAPPIAVDGDPEQTETLRDELLSRALKQAEEEAGQEQDDE